MWIRVNMDVKTNNVREFVLLFLAAFLVILLNVGITAFIYKLVEFIVGDIPSDIGAFVFLALLFLPGLVSKR